MKLGLCRTLVKEEQFLEDSSMPELSRRASSTCGASSMTDSAESEASDSANTESRGCRTSGSSESMDALEEDDLDTCSSSRSGFFHFGSVGFAEGLDSDSQEERNRIETSGFLCLLDLAQSANPQCQKTECSQGPTPETCSWGPELSVGRLDPRLYEVSRTNYYSLCSSVSPASHLSDSSESTASRQGNALPAWGQQGWTKTQPGSTLEALALHPQLAFEDGSSDEEYYDAADKLTPPGTLSGEPLSSSVALGGGSYGPKVKLERKSCEQNRSTLEEANQSQASCLKSGLQESLGGLWVSRGQGIHFTVGTREAFPEEVSKGLNQREQLCHY
jgi:hypothetical protein